MNTRSDEVLLYLTNLNWGKGHAEEIFKAYEFLGQNRVRKLDKADAHKIGLEVLYIETRGKGTGQVLNAIKFATADIDRVTKAYANVCVNLENGERRVLHIRKDSPKLSVIK